MMQRTRVTTVGSWFFLSLSVLTTEWAPLAAAADPWPAVGADGNAEATIAQALARDTQLEFVETPLEDVVYFLRDHHAIPIEIDKRGLEDVGLGKDTPITRNLKGITLASALRLLLEELGLGYTVRDEVVLITSREQLQTLSAVRAYDVGRLLDNGLTAEQLAQTLGKLFEPPVVSEGVPAAPRLVNRIVSLRQLLLVHATLLGHEQVARVLGDVAASQKTPEAKGK
jgi:hypothetical protein